MKDIVVSTWGIGPSYRSRVIHNIKKAIATGYDNILPYIILTDKPEDFFELKNETNKVIDIININDMRNEYSPWSKEYEYISSEVDERDYGIDYRVKANMEIRFSYALHRFSLIRISELGYNRFLMCDSDTDIRYDRIINGEVTESAFWDEYNTPVNSMKGCDFERFTIRDGHDWGNGNIMMANILRYSLIQKFPQYEQNIKHKILLPEYTQTEGPFRYYNLTTPEMVKEYFKVWDETLKMCFPYDTLRRQLTPGNYMYLDNTPVSVTNELLGIRPLNFDKFWHKVNIYKDDRYFFPQGSGWDVYGKQLSLQPAENREEFNIKNKELIDYLISIGQWDK